MWQSLTHEMAWANAHIALAGLAVSAAAMERLYRHYLRAWVLTWGATAEEVAHRPPRTARGHGPP